MHKTIRRQSSTTISGTLHEPLPAPPAQTVSEVPAPAQQIPAQRQDVIPRRPIIAPRIDFGLLEELKAHGTPVARMTRRDALANFSDEHKNTLHKILLEKIESDAASMTSRQGRRILKALRAYAALDLDENSLDTLSSALTNILRLLREYSPPEDNPREAEAIGYYRAYFGSRCNGSLEKPDLERVYHLDYSEKRIACPKVAKSLFTPGWTDVRQQPLFPREPSVNDIQQRDLGDCYLEAALGSLVLHAPNRLKDCIRDNGDGTVTVRFFTKHYEPDTLPAGLRRILSEAGAGALNDEELIFRMFADTDENSLSEIWRQAFHEANETATAAFLRASMPQQASGSGGDGAPAQAPEAQPPPEQRSMDPVAEIAKIVEIFDAFSNIKPLNVRRLESARELAGGLASTDGFSAIVREMRQAQDAPGAQMGDVLTAGIKKFFSMDGDLWTAVQTMPGFTSFQNANAPGAEPLLHPLYVTVSKEIPRVLGADVYTANALWVQMFQKAYAASGLHNADSPLSAGNRAQAEALYRKSHGLGSGAVLAPEQERQAELEWRHSYHQIIGGQSNSFLELLTGAPAQTDELEIITGKNIEEKLPESLGCPCLSLDPTALRIMDELGWNKTEKGLLSKVWPKLLEQIRRRYTAPYKKAEEDGSGWKWETYAKRAVTIEDLQWVLHDYDRWRDADGSVNQQLDPLMALCGGPNQYIEKVSVFVGRYFSELDAGPLLHDPFSAGGMPYARRAAAVYEKIQAALERNEPVCAGSHRFVPPELEHLMDDSPESLSGIVEGHAYSIVDCMEIDGRKYIILRNPWGKLEREYVRFTCPDGTVHVGTRAVKHRNPLTQSDTRGMFQMELNDFLSKFSRIYFNTPPREGA